MQNKKSSRGMMGENAAAEYYQGCGYTIVARNYRTRQGEIDLIIANNGLLVFAEVKARSEGSIAMPREWVDARKQQRIVLAAKAYLQKYELSEPLMRFDVVEVYFEKDGKTKINCIENAFSL